MTGKGSISFLNAACRGDWISNRKGRSFKDAEFGTTGRERQRNRGHRAWQRAVNGAGSSDGCKRQESCVSPKCRSSIRRWQNARCFVVWSPAGAVKEIGRYVTFCDETG